MAHMDVNVTKRARAERNVRKAISDALATAPRGTQAQLARELGVHPIQVTRWKDVDGGTLPDPDRWPDIERVLAVAGMAPGALRAAWEETSETLLFVSGAGLPGKMIRADVVAQLLEDQGLSAEEAKDLVWRAVNELDDETRERPRRPKGRRRNP